MPQQGDGIALTSASAARRRSLAVWIWSALLIADAILLTHCLSGDFQFPRSWGLELSSTVIVAALSWVAWSVYSASLSDRSPPSAVSLAQRISRSLIPRGLSVAITAMWGGAVFSQASPLMQVMLSAIVLLQAITLVVWDQERPRTTEAGALPSFGEQSGRIDNFSGSLLSEHGSRVEHSSRVKHSAAKECCKDPSVKTSVIPELTLAPGTSVQCIAPKDAETHDSHDSHDFDEPDEISDESQTLWLSRRLTADGELIEGWVRIDFAAGQREAVVHVAFCPPLKSAPELETEDLEGVGLEIRVAAVFPFGARLSVRRSGSLEERHTDRVGFIAQTPSNSRAA